MLERLKQVAAEREGVCLSTTYVNNSQLLQFECKNGHQWKTTSKIILQGCWCKKCFFEKRAARVKVGIETARELARSRGGECLSDTYENAASLMHWRCQKGHEWETPYRNIKTGNWCRICANSSRRHDISNLQQIAKDRGGELISIEYSGLHSHYKWKCEKGHEWEASFGNVLNQNTWCPYCSGRYNYSLAQITENMKTRNGVCLIDRDAKADEILTFRCNNEHQWNARATNVFYHQCWCPHCPFKNESYCKKVFEHLFSREFNKRRPAWLINPDTNYKLELDGYCEYESLAFEYDGEQHFRYVPYFHNSEGDFLRQQARDKIKKELCVNNEVTLINIPYTRNNKRSIDNYIINVLTELGYAFTLDDVTNLIY